MNRVLCDVQTLQMKNQQELFSLLQSRLERVSYSVTVPSKQCAAGCYHIPALQFNLFGFFWFSELITEAVLLSDCHLTVNAVCRQLGEAPG